jgi:periplasmic divalent cation tolerance protein
MYPAGVSEIRIVLCTFPDAASARQIGTALVEKQLAACVNLIPAVESVYRWQGRLETAAEVLAVIKTSAAAFPDLKRELAKLHPYEIPEIIAIEPAAVTENYASWLLGSLSPAMPEE